VIDILAVGVAMRRGGDALPALEASLVSDADEGESALAQRSAPGVSLAGPLARLTSHSR